MHVDHRMFALMQGVRLRVVLTCLAGLGAIGAMVGQGVLTAMVLNRIFDGADWGSAAPTLAGVVALVAVQGILIWLREVAGMWTAAGIKITLRQRLYTHLLELGPGYLERTETGKVQATLVDGVEALEFYMGHYVPQLFVCIVAPAAILGTIFWLDVVVGTICLLAMLLALFGEKLYLRLLGDYASEHWDAYRNLNTVFLDSMQGLTTLKAFNASKRRGDTLDNTARTLLDATKRQMSASLAGTGLIALATALVAMLSVGVGALRVAQGSLTMAELFVILFLTSQAVAPLVDLNTYWHQGFLGISSVTGILEILRTEPEVHNQPASVQPIPIPQRMSISVENVSFAYGAGTRPALHNLSFEVCSGETIAMVGRSGSGKSTIVSLLLRFFDPQAGRITIDGRDLREIPLATLRGMLSVVSQDTYLFHGTVADNLRLAKPEATQAEIEAAARMANAHGFVTSLGQGYETIVGERGMRLSGGQRQRLAIARALLKDVPILILDEATSSVDAANEAAIQEALDRLTHDRTTLIIAHRLSTIVNADRIIVLDDGRVVEAGNHHDLLTSHGIYTRLVAAQQGDTAA